MLYDLKANECVEAVLMKGYLPAVIHAKVDPAISEAALGILYRRWGDIDTTHWVAGALKDGGAVSIVASYVQDTFGGR